MLLGSSDRRRRATRPRAVLRPRPRGVQIAVERVERQGIGALHIASKGPTARLTPDGDDPRLARARRSALRPRPRTRRLPRLAEAEGAVHGVPADDVHFHELGAADTLVDICGTFALLDDLGDRRTSCARRCRSPADSSTLRTASSRCRRLRRWSSRGAPLVGVERRPSSSRRRALRCRDRLGDAWGELPPLTLERWATARDPRLADRPNIVRVLLGDPTSAPTAAGGRCSRRTSTTSPELVPDAVERCFAAGALDVWTVPAQMKKGRPGFVLSALARPDDEGAVARRSSRTRARSGVASRACERYELEREEHVVEVDGGPSASRSASSTDASSTSRPSTTTARRSPRRPGAR